MGLLSWVIFGALAGWVASLIMGTDRRQGCLTNIVVGIVGAFLGGLLVELATGYGVHFNLFNLRSFIVAVLGSVLLLAITGASRRRPW
jgi:uncharacterized membrane protein YeaQ/YmgE (transglycosylase-associated protein family)